MKISGAKVLDAAAGLYTNYIPKRSGRGSSPAIALRRVDRTGTCNCRVCNASLLQLAAHLSRVHDLTVAAYRARYGADAPVTDEDALARHREAAIMEGERRYRMHGRKVCVVCQTTFWRKKRARGGKTCSLACRQQLAHQRRRGATKNCPICGKEFYAFPGGQSHRFCSLGCRNAAGAHPNVVAAAKRQGASLRLDAAERRNLICVICRRLFKAARLDAKTCSYDCRTVYTGSNRPRLHQRNRVVLKCGACGKDFEVKASAQKHGRKFCTPACYWTARTAAKSARLARPPSVKPCTRCEAPFTPKDRATQFCPGCLPEIRAQKAQASRAANPVWRVAARVGYKGNP